MPVIRTRHKLMQAGNRPEWSRVTGAGIFRVPLENGTFDCHFHDCDEYWLIYKGKARVMSEGQSYYVQPGDIVCTRAGDEHDFLEVYDAIEAFFLEDASPEGGRIGHLHRDEVKAQGHPVPALPLPQDFPA